MKRGCNVIFNGVRFQLFREGLRVTVADLYCVLHVPPRLSLGRGPALRQGPGGAILQYCNILFLFPKKDKYSAIHKL